MKWTRTHQSILVGINCNFHMRSVWSFTTDDLKTLDATQRFSSNSGKLLLVTYYTQNSESKKISPLKNFVNF